MAWVGLLNLVPYVRDIFNSINRIDRDFWLLFGGNHCPQFSNGNGCRVGSSDENIQR